MENNLDIYSRDLIDKKKYLVLYVDTSLSVSKLEKYINKNKVFKNKIEFYNIEEIEIEKQIDEYLMELSSPPSLKGYNYIKEAVNYTLHEQSNKIRLYKEIYPYLSKKYNTSSSAIESAIRRLIDKTITNVPYDLKQEIFHQTIYNKEEEHNPSNKMFIKIISEQIDKEIKTKRGTTLFL